MSLEKQKSRFRQLDEWFLSELGCLIASSFEKQLNLMKELLHGEVLLQLGLCGNNSWLSELRFQHKWVASPFYNENRSTFVSSLTNLPIDRNSIDCILSPLVLEAFPGSTQIVDEIDRVLRPMGYVIFFGINPWSIWSYWLSHSDESFYGHLRGKAKSVFSLKRGLLHHGFIQCHFNSFYYLPPITSQKWVNRLGLLNQIGSMINIVPPGFYFLIMQKYQEEPLLLDPISLKERFSRIGTAPMYNNLTHGQKKD